MNEWERWTWQEHHVANAQTDRSNRVKVTFPENAEELMMIMATAGLANNFGAIKSLVTKGIQQGHMKMHLFNILNHIEATKEEKAKAVEYFVINKVSYGSVQKFIDNLRQN